MNNPKIAIIGLGYVGLPLAIEFAKKYKVIGFDIDQDRINELEQGIDHTLEANLEDLASVVQNTTENIGLIYASNIEHIKTCTIYIVTVPTPIDHLKAPNLQPLLAATAMLGQILKKNDIVIYESTVYPGCTEEDCVPVLQRVSGLTYNIDFFLRLLARKNKSWR
jgi:UDP-N-acetyl-D-galactosamine dehydrogenase